ncbi:hypothetical protein ILUMI_18039 [Ignelater luminosus]|uniref:Uncharacterized protein n=1 Tax=Ignelater luminosus TaxID=2038154 RepID=A0A8K0G6S4_IGNLU|nr:hypothetical protein ILUMI_18039 [Ignelater luminosus]
MSAVKTSKEISRNCRYNPKNHFPNGDLITIPLADMYIHRVVDRFRRPEAVATGKSSGCTTVLTEDVLKNVRTHMEQSPKKFLRQLSQQTSTFK